MITVTFGLTEEHLTVIENELSRFKNRELVLYDARTWEKLGKELGWCPLTLSLYYFRHKNESTTRT